MNLSDYDDVLVHGTLPLVRDATGIRFARLGVDAPGDCIGDATGLPNSALTLHVFDHQQVRDGWVQAARRFAGNTIEIISPPKEFIGAVVLEIDHSRPRKDGATLNEAVELPASSQKGLAGQGLRMSTILEETLKREQLALGRNAWKDAWTQETSVIAANPVTSLRHVSSFDLLSADDPLGYEINERGFHRYYALSRAEDGYVIAWSFIKSRLDDDLRDEFAKRMTDAGASWHPDGLSISVPTFDDDAIQKAVSTKEVISDAAEEMSRRQFFRDHVRSSLENDKMMSYLRKARLGAPIVVERFGDVAQQINPRTGTPSAVPATHLSTAFRSGWLDLVYAGDFFDGDGVASNARLPSVFVLNKAGKALCDGDPEAAAALVETAKAVNKDVEPRRLKPVNPHDSISSSMPWLEPEHLERMAAGLATRLDGIVNDRFRFSRGIQLPGMAVVIAGVLTGQVSIADDHGLVLADSAAPTPAA